MSVRWFVRQSDKAETTQVYSDIDVPTSQDPARDEVASCCLVHCDIVLLVSFWTHFYLSFLDWPMRDAPLNARTPPPQDSDSDIFLRTSHLILHNKSLGG